MKSELRLGSIIAHNNEQCVVFSLSKEWLRVTKDRNVAISYDNISGVPITEDRLLRFGFEKIATFNVMNSFIKNIGRNRHISIGCIGTPNLMVFLCETDREDYRKVNDLICLHNWDYDGELYVHQLQNIISDLTRQERVEHPSLLNK